MRAWEADARYQTLEDALEDLSISFEWVLASLKGAAGLQHPDIPTIQHFGLPRQFQKARPIPFARKGFAQEV
jgi:hypothetical protein